MSLAHNAETAAVMRIIPGADRERQRRFVGAQRLLRADRRELAGGLSVGTMGRPVISAARVEIVNTLADKNGQCGNRGGALPRMVVLIHGGTRWN